MTEENHQIGAGEFKTHCLKLIDRVNQTKQPIIITKHGKPMAKLTPYTQNFSAFFNKFLSEEECKDFQQEDRVSAANRAQGVTLSFGKGRVIVLAEAAMISAQIVQIPNEGEFLIGMNNTKFDNQQFALNSMHWLSGLLN
jgi:prevent-host-death family protein